MNYSQGKYLPAENYYSLSCIIITFVDVNLLWQQIKLNVPFKYRLIYVQPTQFKNERDSFVYLYSRLFHAKVEKVESF